MAETKEELAARLQEALEENAHLRRRVEELEQQQEAGALAAPVAPRATFNLTEGTRQELEANRDNPDFTTLDPFTGAVLTPADLDRLDNGNRAD